MCIRDSTYFAADIAYHYNKFVTRGFDWVIDVWGADHHGHVARLKGAMDAVGLDGDKLDIVLMQLVRLMRGGEVVPVSYTHLDVYKRQVVAGRPSDPPSHANAYASALFRVVFTVRPPPERPAVQQGSPCRTWTR